MHRHTHRHAHIHKREKGSSLLIIQGVTIPIRYPERKAVVGHIPDVVLDNERYSSVIDVLLRKSLFDWPPRAEMLQIAKPWLLVDAVHNVDGIAKWLLRSQVIRRQDDSRIYPC